MKRISFAAALLGLMMGCSASEQGSAEFQNAQERGYGFAKSAPMSQAEAMTQDELKSQQLLGRGQFAKAAATSPNIPGQSKAAPAAERKIIYNGDIELLVDKFSDAAQRLHQLIKQYQGIIAQSEINSNPGVPRSARWRVRIPTDRFEDFVSQVAALGEALKDKTDSDDITDKYYDIQVRIENKKVQLDRLQKIIKEQMGKLSELFEAERELGRVTTELEELKGTLKLWESQTSLGTVNVTIHERQTYVAPEKPTFAKNIASTFGNSLDNLIAVGQGVTLFSVALAPWLPFIVLFGFVLYFPLRRATRRLMPLAAGPSGRADSSNEPGGRM